MTTHPATTLSHLNEPWVKFLFLFPSSSIFSLCRADFSAPIPLVQKFTFKRRRRRRRRGKQEIGGLTLLGVPEPLSLAYEHGRDVLAFDTCFFKEREEQPRPSLEEKKNFRPFFSLSLKGVYMIFKVAPSCPSLEYKETGSAWLIALKNLTVGNYGSEWHTAEQQITSAYRAFSSEKIVANLGVHIGFGHVNVSLRCKWLTQILENGMIC